MLHSSLDGLVPMTAASYEWEATLDFLFVGFNLLKKKKNVFFVGFNLLKKKKTVFLLDLIF